MERWKDGLGETIKLMGCSECNGKSSSKFSLSGTVATVASMEQFQVTSKNYGHPINTSIRSFISDDLELR